MIKRYLVHTFQVSIVIWIILTIAVINSSISYAVLNINGASEIVSFSAAMGILVLLLFFGLLLVPKSFLKIKWRVLIENDPNEPLSESIKSNASVLFGRFGIYLILNVLIIFGAWEIFKAITARVLYGASIDVSTLTTIIIIAFIIGFIIGVALAPSPFRDRFRW